MGDSSIEEKESRVTYVPTVRSEQGGLPRRVLVTGGSALQVWSDASVCGVPTSARGRKD